jgi:hypothetical protein
VNREIVVKVAVEYCIVVISWVIVDAGCVLIIVDAGCVVVTVEANCVVMTVEAG